MQFERAARLIEMHDPAVPVTLAVLDMDDPTNFATLRDRKIASFPVGRFYRLGIDAGAYTGGPGAPEIAQEALRRARAEKAQQSGPDKEGRARGRD